MMLVYEHNNAAGVFITESSLNTLYTVYPSSADLTHNTASEQPINAGQSFHLLYNGDKDAEKVCVLLPPPASFTSFYPPAAKVT